MSKLETNTIDTVSGTTNLVIGSTNSSTVTFENGAATGHMYPAFEVQRTTDQSIPNNTATKIQYDQTNFDTNSGWSGTNYRWTPGIAGKYCLYCSALQKNMTDDTIAVYIYKNGSIFAFNQIQTGSTNNGNSCLVITIDHQTTTTDYYEVFIYHDIGSSQNLGGNATKRVIFGGYRIGA